MTLSASIGICALCMHKYGGKEDGADDTLSGVSILAFQCNHIGFMWCGTIECVNGGDGVV